MDKKRVYIFGNGQAEGKADMKNLLGGKGANLAEMNLIGIPVPPGFTITTDVCTEYNTLGRDKVVELLKDDVVKAIANVEALMKSKFGDIDNPLLVSVRSGARASMPGMMDTILNLGLNDEVVEGIIRKTGNARFAWVVKELEERNLLVKQADEKDKRVINLTLTEEGKEFVELRVTHFHGEWASRLPDLDDAVVDEFVHAITRMQETMPGIKGVKNNGKRK